MIDYLFYTLSMAAIAFGMMMRIIKLRTIPFFTWIFLGLIFNMLFIHFLLFSFLLVIMAFGYISIMHFEEVPKKKKAKRGRK